MKTLSLVVISLLLFPAVLAGASRAVAVNVYFVRNSFTAAEKQLLWEAIESWAEKAKKKGREIRFVSAGETGGLIDCAGCLTIARHAPTAYANREQVSFNLLRQADNVGLISAWIGFQHEGASASNLRTLMLQALERGLAPNASQTQRVDAELTSSLRKRPPFR